MCKHICKTSNLLALFSEDIFAVKETQRYFCTILGYCLWAAAWEGYHIDN